MKFTHWRFVLLPLLFVFLNHLVDGGPFDLLVSVYAQSATTQVTATITDPNGLPYTNAAISVQLVPAPSGPAICAGAGQVQNPNPFTANANGFFSVNLCPNASISTPGTQWQFIVSLSPGVPPPLGTGPQTCSATVTISGVSQDISSSFSCPALSNSSGNGVGNGAAPAIRYYFAPTCPTADPDGVCIKAFGDTQPFNDCSWSTASPTITCNTPHFGPGQAIPNPVGMSVMGFQTCSGDVTQAHGTGGEIAPNAVMPTVIQLVDSQHIVISQNPANTQALVTTAPVGGCLVLGHIEDANFASLWTQVNAAKSCPKVTFGAGNYLITTPPEVLWDMPAACKNIGPALGGSSGNPGFGTVTLNAGFEVEGCGTGCVGLYLATNFPNGDSCQHVPTSSVSNPLHVGACFAIPVMGRWHDFRIDGGGQWAASALAGKTLGPYMAIGKLENFLCMNYGAYIGSSSTGIELSFQNKLWHVNNAGCGSIGIYVDSGATANIGYDVVVESSSVSALLTAGPGAFAGQPNFECFWCQFALSQSNPLGNFGLIRSTGGSIHLVGGAATPANGNDGGLNVNSGVQLYLCATTSPCTLSAEHFNFNANNGSSNNNSALVCSVACNTTLENSILSSQSAGFDYQDVSGSLLTNLGGNVYSPHFSIAGTVAGTDKSVLSVASRNSSLSSTTLLPSTKALNASGVAIYAYDSAAGSGCTGNTTVTWTVSYTDPTNNAQTSTAVETITTNGGATGGDALKTSLPIAIKPGTAVNISTVYAIGTGCTTGPSYAAIISML